MIIDYCNNKRIKIKRKGLSPLQYKTKSFTSNRVANFWGQCISFTILFDIFQFLLGLPKQSDLV
ncbi:TPA: IS3 family transposase [Streptococcus pyogenes]|uniref:IS3 family transposase n=1 Tax=Streptococcus pyogenes TaxID=1314 RepID=UPI003904A979